jgi:hypothetical protein
VWEKEWRSPFIGNGTLIPSLLSLSLITSYKWFLPGIDNEDAV